MKQISKDDMQKQLGEERHLAHEKPESRRAMTVLPILAWITGMLALNGYFVLAFLDSDQRALIEMQAKWQDVVDISLKVDSRPEPEK
jgi:hypothetical protein